MNIYFTINSFYCPTSPQIQEVDEFTLKLQKCNPDRVFMKYLILKFLVLLLTTSVHAFDCAEQSSPYALGGAVLGEKSLPGFWTQEMPKEEKACFDFSKLELTEKQNKTLQELRSNGSIDEFDCINLEKLEKNKTAEAQDFIFHITNRPMRIVINKNVQTDQIQSVVLTNGDAKFIQDNKLTNKDKMELAGITLLSSTIGVLIERQAFKGQHDKMLHANYGAAINIGSNLASYLVIEEMGVGDKFNLTKNQKKVAILLSGTAMGALVGYAKERFYDYYRRKNHTYDAKFNGDMGATMLGGGAVTPLLISFTTSW